MDVITSADRELALSEQVQLFMQEMVQLRVELAAARRVIAEQGAVITRYLGDDDEEDPSDEVALSVPIGTDINLDGQLDPGAREG